MNAMSNPVQEPDETSASDSKSGASIAQLVVGWVLVLVGGLCAIITLFTFPFVLQEQGTDAIPQAIAFIVPEIVVLVVGGWLIRRGQRGRRRK
jgi:lipopolysaccharide export LptBFGC system permease protein LptF